MLLDSQNNIWIATRQGSLLVHKKKENKIIDYTANIQKGSVKDNSITQIFEDSYHRIWIGTSRMGLSYYDKKTDSFKHELSVGENGISGIIEDKNKTLWISTDKGLTKINLVTKKTFSYTKDDGLYSDNFNANSAICTREGELFFGTINGLISFNPNSIGEKVFQPNVILTKLYIGGEEVSDYGKNSPLETTLDESTKITLTNQQASSFAIEYAAIFYGHSQSMKYATFMEGVDKNWNILNDQRRVNFSGLPSGKYVFKVKAVSSNEDWKNAPVRSITIIIKPPFYLSVWAWLIYLALATALTIFVNRLLKIRRDEKNQIQLERIERNKIEEINRTKIDFFTNISHELKTPLTLIISPLQRLIESDNKTVVSKETMGVILRNAQRMSRIVDELMTFSKIEIGKEKLTLHKGNVLEFISNISITFKLLAIEKNINFNAVIENNGEDVWFSIANIEKIVYNLLSNSFKFTSKGGNVTIEARLTEDDNNKIFLEIIVSDTGEGIQKEYLDRIFENYFQADPKLNIRGSGIGLSLTKRLINLHNGDIEVESELGKGSIFRVKLDVSEESYSKEEKFTEILDNDFFKKYNYITIEKEIVEKSNAFLEEQNEEYIKSVLLVDDNEELLKFLCDIFQDKFRIFTADNGRSALEIVYKENPDLIISDVMMPEMDGFELCQHVKTDFNTCHIPVILLTAKTGSEDKMEGYEMGADFYIEKPFNARLLEMQVQNIIKTRLKNIELLKNNPQKSEQRNLMNERDCAFVERLNEIIEKNIDNQFFSISDITKSLNVSRTLLHVKCKKLIDTSVTDYLRERRMNKAKEMMTAGHNISETAYAVGFSDPGYFSKVFKKQFNISPSDFIKNFDEASDNI
jgi:signal transduction histidine kinase/DNA-binding response OmpR family regulator